MSPPLSVQQPFPFRRVGGWSEKIHKANQVFKNIKKKSFYGIQFLNAWFCIGFTYLYLSSLFTVFPMPSVSPSICSAGFGDTWHLLPMSLGKPHWKNQWTPCLSCEKMYAVPTLNKKTPGLSKPLLSGLGLASSSTMEVSKCRLLQQISGEKLLRTSSDSNSVHISDDVEWYQICWHISGVFKCLQWYDPSFGPF